MPCLTERETRCPICGKNNDCGANTGNCWCFGVKVPQSLLDTIPADQRNRSCVCRECAEGGIAPKPVGLDER